jgi:hypothetical protein
MAREELQRASEALRDAAEAADDPDVEERIYDYSDRLAGLATADRGPDHGRLARIENAFHEILDETSGDAHEHVADALDHVQEYRSGVEGV